MKILIYGAGVLGSLYAAKLSEAGIDVSILARRQRLKDINTYGIILNNLLSGEKTSTKVKTVESLGSNDYYDLVIVIMRKNQVESILPILAENDNVPSILFLGNNTKGAQYYSEAVGSERVLLGFPGAGGYFEDHEIKCLFSDKTSITLGEPSNILTPRVKEIKNIFNQAKISVKISENIDAWLKTHVALIVPLVCALYMCDTDIYRLAENKAALKLFNQGFKEAIGVLKNLNVPILPKRVKTMTKIPEWLLVAIMKKRFKTELSKVALEGHARVARDEMGFLGKEFRDLITQSGLPTPKLDELYKYLL